MSDEPGTPDLMVRHSAYQRVVAERDDAHALIGTMHTEFARMMRARDALRAVAQAAAAWGDADTAYEQQVDALNDPTAAITPAQALATIRARHDARVTLFAAIAAARKDGVL